MALTRLFAHRLCAKGGREVRPPGMWRRYGPPMSVITTTEIMRIAARRDELITLHQLRKHGLSRDAIARLVSGRVLTPVYRAVYTVVPGPLSDDRRMLA